MNTKYSYFINGDGYVLLPSENLNELDLVNRSLHSMSEYPVAHVVLQ